MLQAPLPELLVNCLQHLFHRRHDFDYDDALDMTLQTSDQFLL